MRYIMRKICLFPVMIAVMVFTGCGQKKNEDPVTVIMACIWRTDRIAIKRSD